MSPWVECEQINQSQKEEEEGELAYEPHSPYYSPVHPPEFYGDEWTFVIYIPIKYVFKCV